MAWLTRRLVSQLQRRWDGVQKIGGSVYARRLDGNGFSFRDGYALRGSHFWVRRNVVAIGGHRRA